MTQPITKISLEREKSYPISDHMYGIFLEDIGFGADGGLNANMVDNYSFDGVYMDPETNKRVEDSLRYWEFEGANFQSENAFPVSHASKYAAVSVDGHAKLTNKGYNGRNKQKDQCAMSILAEADYTFSAWIRNNDYSGEILIKVADDKGMELTTCNSVPVSSKEWNYITIHVTGTANGYGKLLIEFTGKGTLYLDCISFYNSGVWHRDDPKWRHGKLRKDLVESLKELHPRFMRFPGGCIVEGMEPGNEYNWKNTVGELWERKSDFNLWSEKTPGGGYNQSFQIGFYEYFCLCEDLNMEPLPTLFAGLNCQIRKLTYKYKYDLIPEDSEEFQSCVVQNYLDLIEFATGAPKEGKWAALRAEMGHPEPFRLHMIGVGNENFLPDYRKRFEIISTKIHDKYPDIRLVMSAGVAPAKIFINPAWKYAKKHKENIIIDEHAYHSPKWFIKSEKRFDKYPRGTAKVYVGEFSANGLLAGKKMTIQNSNWFESALGEAVFMTGLERNGDVVEMASYAPLLNLVGSEHWYTNLIDFNPGTVCPTINYWNQYLFFNYCGTKYIPVKGKLPEGMYVSVTADGENTFMKLVNVGNQDYDVEVEGDFAAGSEAEKNELYSERQQAQNRLSFTGTPENEVLPKKSFSRLDGCCLHLKLKKNSIVAVKIMK